jgi:hypothetical protein
MGIGLQTMTIRGLKGAQFLGLAFANVDREIFVDEKVPNLFAFRPGVKGLVLSVTDPPELRVGLERLSAVAIADYLEDAFALVDLLAQHGAEISGFGPENFLPDRLVTEEGEGIRGELAAASELSTDGGYEDERKRRHRRVLTREFARAKRDMAVHVDHLPENRGCARPECPCQLLRLDL